MWVNSGKNIDSYNYTKKTLDISAWIYPRKAYILLLDMWSLILLFLDRAQVRYNKLLLMDIGYRHTIFAII